MEILHIRRGAQPRQDVQNLIVDVLIIGAIISSESSIRQPEQSAEKETGQPAEGF